MAQKHRGLSADVKIQELVHILEDFLPLKTYQDKGVSFKSIFAESRIFTEACLASSVSFV